MRNRYLNELRDRKRANEHLAPSPNAFEDLPERRSTSPDLQAQNADTQRALRIALATLPETQRTAFVLSKIEGRSCEETAETLGITVSACESLIHRARLNLRDRLRALLERAK